MIAPSIFIHQQSVVSKMSSVLPRLHLGASRKMIALFFTVQVSTSRNCGAVWLLSTLQKCLCLLLALLSFHIWWFDGFVDLSSKVLCVCRSLYLRCFFCLFVSGWIQNMFHLCCCSQRECSFLSTASSLAQQASPHSTKDYHENYSA